MKKVLVLILLLLTAPAMAAVTITLTENPAESGIVEVSYSCSDANLPRAFGLNVDVSGDEKGHTGIQITGVTNVNSNFRVYPTAIQNDPCGKIGGSPVVGSIPSGYGTGIILEMSTLHGVGDPCGFVNPPPASALLCKIVTAGKANGFGITNNFGKVTVSENTQRGGVVMENYLLDPSDNLPQSVYVGQPCINSAAGAKYTTWLAWDYPECWCYKKQCNGDLNGASFWGRPVANNDLSLFKLAFGKTDAELRNVSEAGVPGICADLNYAAFWGRRVANNDLGTFKTYFGDAEATVPICPDTNMNFWTN